MLDFSISLIENQLTITCHQIKLGNKRKYPCLNILIDTIVIFEIQSSTNPNCTCNSYGVTTSAGYNPTPQLIIETPGPIIPTVVYQTETAASTFNPGPYLCGDMHAISWDGALASCRTLIDIYQGGGYRWFWARQLIDMGDALINRNGSGDRVQVQEVYRQSLKMFREMDAPGYIQVLEERLGGM